MTIANKYQLGGLLAMLAIAPYASADDEFYCGSKIVTEGLSKAQVLERCGEPRDKSVDQWVYDRGPDDFDVLLHFDGDNQVERITEETERGQNN